ncbi:Rabankyrin-5 [Lasiodiplodia theobromae]|uniref:Rabankyrin-5 n=1 Tax=Lasiodiplodia theobromae TaxID=45133 RepID=A0A5N5DB38_9PEZI|nr:Rabankyrin-5 [Lasiodiplodia theobromae]
MWRPTPHQTAILSACATQPLQTVLSLLSTCPDPPPSAKCMADAAATHGNAPVLDHLVRSGATHFKGFLLFYSAAAHSRACVEIMLDHGGCDINARDDRIGNVLNWALAGRRGCPDAFIAWLLARGARPCRGDDEQVPQQEWTLRLAVTRGSVGILRMLVAHGAGADQVDASRALHTAVARGEVEMVRFLVEEAGADVNEPGWYRWEVTGWMRDPGRPLHRAAEKGFGGLVEYLLAHGARVDVRDGAGRTPFQVAFANGRENVVELGMGMIGYVEGNRTRRFG